MREIVTLHAWPWRRDAGEVAGGIWACASTTCTSRPPQHDRSRNYKFRRKRDFGALGHSDFSDRNREGQYDSDRTGYPRPGGVLRCLCDTMRRFRSNWSGAIDCLWNGHDPLRPRPWKSYLSGAVRRHSYIQREYV